MGYSILAICDEQEVYSELLVNRWLRREEAFYQICRFSKPEQLEAFAKEQEVACLLVSEYYDYLIENIEAKAYYCLTEMRDKQGTYESGSKQYIYRYQSADEIYQILKSRLEESDTHLSRSESEELGEDRLEDLSFEGVQLIGIYNPVHRNGQTLFAKGLAQCYGRMGKRVLYLSMEEYAGVVKAHMEGPESGNLQNSGDLGEVLYYMKQDMKQISMRLSSFTKQRNGYDYVEPIHMSKELRMITGEEWQGFLKEIQERSGYEVVILDLDSCVQGLLDILEMCTKVYMPVREVVGGQEKRIQFMENLKLLQRQALEDKIMGIQLPNYQGDGDEGVSGEAIRGEVIRGESISDEVILEQLVRLIWQLEKSISIGR